MALAASTVSVPGSLMWFGEHAVLEGFPCVVGAVDARMRLSLRPRDDGQLRIDSQLGDYEAPIDGLRDDERFRFALAAARESRLGSGASIGIESTFSSTVGFGSSAAVTVGMVALLSQSEDRRRIFDRALAAVRAVQGRGSGADVAASVYGGLVAYQSEPADIEPLTCEPPPISVVYSGTKTPTPDVIARVRARREQEPEEVAAALRRVGEIAACAPDAILAGDWTMVGELMNTQQRLAAPLGVTTPELDAIVAGLRDVPGMLGAKITGAGLGDCAFGVGVEDATVAGFETLPARVADDGLRFESIV